MLPDGYGCVFLALRALIKGLISRNHVLSVSLTGTHNILLWLVLLAVHGEFELFLSVRPDDVKKLHDEAAQTRWNSVLVGEVTSGRGIHIKAPDRFIPLDTAKIRNLSHAAGSEPEQYIKKLIDIARTAGI